MKAKTNRRKHLLKVLIVIILFVSNYNKTSAQNSDPTEVLEGYYKELNIGMYSLLQVKKKLPGNSEASKNVDLYTIVINSCKHYEEIDPLIEASPMEFAEDQVFERIDERGNFIQLRFENEVFWIERVCVKISSFSENQKFSATSGNNIEWIRITESTKDQQDLIYSKYEKYLKQNRKRLIDQDGNYRLEVQVLVQKIERKKIIIDQIYQRIISVTGGVNQRNELAFGDRLKLNGQVLLGSSNFNSNFYSQENSGNSNSSLDLNIAGRYLVDEHSSVRIGLKNKKETLLSSFNSFNGNVGYDRKLGNNLLKVDALVQNFNDQLVDQNNYNKIQFKSGIKSNNREGFKYNVNYHFLNHGYSNQSSNSYSRHKIDSKINLGQLSSRNYEFGIKFINGSSDNDLYSYTTLNPRFMMNNRTKDRNSSLALAIDYTYFPNQEMRSNYRYIFSYSKTQTIDSKSNIRSSFGLVYRSFPELAASTYFDAFYQSKRSSFGSKKKSLGYAVRTRIYPDLEDGSHVDFRFSSETSKTFFLKYDSNIRIGYPSDQFFPFKHDGYVKVGFDLKVITIGPIFNWQFHYDFKSEDMQTLTSEKNQYRYGVELSGYSKIKDKVRIRYRASYDLNTVYDAVQNETVARNPSNLQFELDLGYTIQKNLELFGSASLFNHKTDYEDIGNPLVLEGREGLRINGGVRFRYN